MAAFVLLMSFPATAVADEDAVAGTSEDTVSAPTGAPADSGDSDTASDDDQHAVDDPEESLDLAENVGRDDHRGGQGDVSEEGEEDDEVGPEPEPEPEPTTEPTVTPGTVTGGRLQWGLNPSFRNYLSMPFVGGDTEKIDPATDDGTQTTFPEATGSWTSSKVDVRTSGGVRFSGHHGVMDFTIRNLRLVVDSRRSQLRADVFNSSKQTFDDLVVATVDLTGRTTISGDTVTITGAPTVLTKSGEKVFHWGDAAMYQAGTQLAPLNATLDVVEPTDPPKPVVDQPGSPGDKGDKGDTGTKQGKPSKESKKAGDKPRKKAKKKTATGARPGELVWGVKSSFRSYITGPIARGRMSVSGGATASGGLFRWGQAGTTAEPPNALGSTTYRGAVGFYGHHGTLNFSIAQPTVRVTSPSRAVLSAAVTGRGRVDIATLDLSVATRTTDGAWVRYAGVPARLTAAGTAVFSYHGSAFYPAGTALDPVTFSVGGTASAGASGGGGSVVAASAPAGEQWTPPPTPPATSGLTVDADEIHAGDEITVTGSGFAPNETGIRVVLYSTPIILAEDVTADASGTATWTGAIPATIEPGEHTLTLQGTVARGVVIDVAEPEEIGGCRLSDGRLDWGFKESFRAYVSGGIANGDWTTRGNASYRTPTFTWSAGEGSRDEKTGAGRLAFTGAVNFTGHDGALDTLVENPTLEFVDDGKAVLRLDYTGGTMDAAMAGKDDSRTLAAVPFADLDLAAATVETSGSTVTMSDVPATLTSAGSAAFPNYPAGTALDPVTVTFTVADPCDTPAAADEKVDQKPAANVSGPAVATDDDTVPVWAVALAGALLGAALAGAGTVLVMRRRTPGAGA